MGMWIFVIVVGMVFAATILGYIVVRLNPFMQLPWRSPSDANLPYTLIVSTLVLFASSATLHQCLKCARRDDTKGCARLASVTYWLGFLFVLLQGEAWWSMWRQNVNIDANLYAWTFYVLTALHVLHIIGGLFALGVVARHASEGLYGAQKHNGIVLCGMYWHSLDVIWIGLYATLWFGSR
ncbi:cytochrome c oxidase subunit 3 [Phycisphaerae bacterium]|nr:cytochrome c oxidase subunit 3 [Phycisphaerae bacterium]